MTNQLEEELAEIISGFINDCGIAQPFHLVCIDAGGSVVVTHISSDGDVEEVCSRTLPDIPVPPLVLTAIRSDGSCKSGWRAEMNACIASTG
jgi:hypothetical protein